MNSENKQFCKMQGHNALGDGHKMRKVRVERRQTMMTLTKMNALLA